MGDVTPEEIQAVADRARCVYAEHQVEAALDAMAAAIADRLADSNPILLCIMNGGLIVSGHLATRLNFPLQMDYLHATRYRGRTSGTELEWKVYPSLAMKGRTLLVVDDILDEGATLQAIVDYCRAQEAAAVYTAVLIDKQHGHKLSTLQADFRGLEAEDYYLFGYGMDYRGYLRNAPGIYAVDEADLD